MLISGNDGISIKINNTEILCDSRKRVGDLNFISHAHSDHLIRKFKNTKILCSRETAGLIINKYYITPRLLKEGESSLNLKLINTGHILGSSALLIEDDEKILYTGDFCNNSRFFLNGFKPPKADVLIIESTYGNREFIFPKQNEVIGEARDWISSELRKNNSVILLGYTLGKAQILTKMVEELNWQVYVHESIARINEIYSFLGTKIKDFEIYGFKQISKPSIFIFPTYLHHSTTIKKIKERFDAKVVMFSGWVIGDGYKYMFNCDEAFPLSDHADFNGLVETVKMVNPKKIFTFHGFADEFANELRKLGYDAISLNNSQKKILDFIEKD
ncbi:MAG: MBL fold metallo-hydrolase [Candidatus Parvarchaeota archaeon]|nr:MBL fold metallo-hydrolase [Candidatus Jingweiarchaeum tengchongense]MCW1304383.1 MBL fold metallo-hydrolase [Candidatus Jingweiarchaeum tengchongense]